MARNIDCKSASLNFVILVCSHVLPIQTLLQQLIIVCVDCAMCRMNIRNHVTLLGGSEFIFSWFYLIFTGAHSYPPFILEWTIETCYCYIYKSLLIPLISQPTIGAQYQCQCDLEGTIYFSGKHVLAFLFIIHPTQALAALFFLPQWPSLALTSPRRGQLTLQHHRKSLLTLFETVSVTGLVLPLPRRFDQVEEKRRRHQDQVPNSETS